MNKRSDDLPRLRFLVARPVQSLTAALKYKSDNFWAVGLVFSIYADVPLINFHIRISYDYIADTVLQYMPSLHSLTYASSPNTVHRTARANPLLINTCRLKTLKS